MLDPQRGPQRRAALKSKATDIGTTVTRQARATATSTVDRARAIATERGLVKPESDIETTIEDIAAGATPAPLVPVMDTLTAHRRRPAARPRRRHEPGRASRSSPTTERPSRRTAGNDVIATGATTGRRLYRDGALADGRSDRLRLGVSILVEHGRVAWIRPSDDEGPLGDAGTLEIVDASGSTIVPGLVDAHSHLTLPGGAHWIDRLGDPYDDQRRYAEANARLLTQAGRPLGTRRRVGAGDR